MQYPTHGKNLTRLDRCHVLDALLDALVELEEDPINEYVTPALIDKLQSATEIIQNDESPA